MCKQLCIAVVVSILSTPAWAHEWYLAPDGDDGNLGTIEKPFATLERARDAVREQTASGLEEPVTVYLRGGKYFVAKTLRLSEKDSGTEDCRVTYAAYPGEKPILSGGKRVMHWRPYQGGILQCDLEGAKGGDWKFRQLFYNGKRQIRARFPNFDPKDPHFGGRLYSEGPAEEGSREAFRYKPDTFPRRWAKPRQAELNCEVGGANWGNNILPLQSIDEEACVITVGRRPRVGNTQLPYHFPCRFRAGQHFVVENLLEELDQPGEWCLDSEDGILYFWPPDDGLDQGEVVVPALATIVDLYYASYLTITGITFTETTGGDDFHRDGVEGIGAGFAPVPGWKYCGEALHMESTAYCQIANNHFHAVGGNAIYMDSFNMRNEIRRNEIGYSGANGICMAGSKGWGPMGDSVGKFVGPMTLRSSPETIPHYNVIVDNDIHHSASINEEAAAIATGICESNLIAHNLIRDGGRHAINLGNSGRSHNIVEYNEIRNTSSGSTDCGAINVWMEDWSRDSMRQGHIIRYNRIIGGDKGIYLDNWASNCRVYENIVVGVSDIGIFVHGGRNNVMENNVLVSCGYAYGLSGWVALLKPDMYGFMFGNRFTRNVVAHSKKAVAWFDKGTVLGEYGTLTRVVGDANDNLFFENTDQDEYLTLLRENGFETDSLVANPMFVDPTKDDYCLEADSPAFKLGFQTIDVSKIGIRKMP